MKKLLIGLLTLGSISAFGEVSTDNKIEVCINENVQKLQQIPVLKAYIQETMKKTTTDQEMTAALNQISAFMFPAESVVIEACKKIAK